MKKDKILKLIGTMAGIGSAVLGGIILESRREKKYISVSVYQIENSKIKEDACAVVISDLHNQEFGRDNKQLIKEIFNINPDFIIIAGDLIMGKPGHKTDVAVKLIKTLGQKYPIYIGRGNHELRADCYKEKYGDMWEEIYGQTVPYSNWLINDSIYLDKYNITISGLDISQKYYRRFKTAPMSADYIEGLLGPVDKNSYNILIAHNPDYFPFYSGYGADLSLSGHIHGGMIIIPGIGGLLSPMVRFFPRYYKGAYFYDGRQMIVSAGLGNHTLKFRVNNKPEIIILKLGNKNSGDTKKN